MKSIIKIRMQDGQLLNWDDLSDSEKKTIGQKLNEQGMVASGFKKAAKDRTA